MAELKYKRVLLKLSGEALAGEKQIGIDPHTVSKICAEIADVVDMGLEVALVIGRQHFPRAVRVRRGYGSFLRGLHGYARHSAERACRAGALEKTGHPTRVLSAIAMQEVCEPYVRRRAMRHLEKEAA